MISEFGCCLTGCSELVSEIDGWQGKREGTYDLLEDNPAFQVQVEMSQEKQR